MKKMIFLNLLLISTIIFSSFGSGGCAVRLLTSSTSNRESSDNRRLFENTIATDNRGQASLQGSNFEQGSRRVLRSEEDTGITISRIQIENCLLRIVPRLLQREISPLQQDLQDFMDGFKRQEFAQLRTDLDTKIQDLYRSNERYCEQVDRKLREIKGARQLINDAVKIAVDIESRNLHAAIIAIIAKIDNVYAHLSDISQRIETLEVQLVSRSSSDVEEVRSFSRKSTGMPAEFLAK
jgi:hypothetical protein